MYKQRAVFGLLFALCFLSLLSEQSLMAYADPGSGAIYVQVILAAILGGLFRIVSLVRRFRRRKSEHINA
jgi:hypothetical protein